MLIAKWWIDGGKLYRRYTPEDHPLLSKVEARCGRCGFALGEGGYPHDGATIQTVLLEVGLVFRPECGVWEPSRRESKRYRQFRRPAENGGSGLPTRYYTTNPRHAQGRPSDSVYLTRDQLRAAQYPPGTVGKLESQHGPRWEVALPAIVRCMQCTWPNTIPLFQPEVLWHDESVEAD